MSEFLIVAFATDGKLDLGVSVTRQEQQAEVHCIALARGRREDVRKVDGVCAGIHQGFMRIRRPC